MFAIAKKSGSKLKYQTFKSNVGNTSIVNIASKYSMTTSTIKNANKTEPKVRRYSASPYIKVKLKKGETIYLNAFTVPDKKSCSYTIKIKK